MGSCVSRPEGSVGPKLRSSKKNKKKQNRKRRKSFEKRVSNGLTDPFSDEFCSWVAPPDHHSSFSNPTFQGLYFICYQNCFFFFFPFYLAFCL